MRSVVRAGAVLATAYTLVTKSTKAEIEHLEDEQERLEVEITKEQIACPIISREHIEEWIMAFAKSDLKNQEQKQRLIDIFINSVHVYDDKIVVLFNYKDGERAVSLEDVENAVKKENTLDECSTLFKSGDPYGNRKSPHAFSNFYQIPSNAYIKPVYNNLQKAVYANFYHLFVKIKNKQRTRIMNFRVAYLYKINTFYGGYHHEIYY